MEYKYMCYTSKQGGSKAHSLLHVNRRIKIMAKIPNKQPKVYTVNDLPFLIRVPVKGYDFLLLYIYIYEPNCAILFGWLRNII